MSEPLPPQKDAESQDDGLAVPSRRQLLMGGQVALALILLIA